MKLELESKPVESSAPGPTPPPWWARVRPEEYVFVAFGITLSLVVQFGTGGRFGWGDLWNQVVWRVDYYLSSQLAWMPLPVAIALLAVVLVGVFWKWRLRVARIARDAAPFLLAYLAYILLRDLIPYIRPDLMDARLDALESAVLGTPTYVWLPQNIRHPILDTFLMGCYLTHYYIPIGLAVFLAFRNRDRFRRLMLALTIAWAVGYLGYIAVPAVGPKYFFANYELWRVNGAIVPAVGVIDTYASVTRDCFPSMHVAWTVLTLWAGWPYRIFTRLYIPIAAGLVLATIYFGFHYLVDLPAGVLVAVGSIYASRFLYRWWPSSHSDKVKSCVSAPSSSGSPRASASS